MRIERKKTIIPEKIIETVYYVCDVCGESYTTELNANRCERSCTIKKQFLENNKPKYQYGSLVKSYYGDSLYVVRYATCNYKNSNDYLGFTYSIDPFIEECEGGADISSSTHIREDSIQKLVLSPEEFKKCIDDSREKGHIIDATVNNVENTIEITLSIKIADIQEKPIKLEPEV